MTLLPLARQEQTIGIMGRRGCGKTMLMSLLGYMEYLRGSIVFSNYHVNYPHTRIYSLEDLRAIYEIDYRKPKLMLGDDFDRWFHARSAHSKMNKDLNDILLDWGKISCSLYYTGKMGGPLSEGKSIDIAIREATSMWLYPDIYDVRTHENPQIARLMSGFLDFKAMRVVRITDGLDVLPNLVLRNLKPLCSLYDTHERVSVLQTY